MRTIALISQKGGVGKTTLAIHLATAFVAAGYNTLLLELDPQTSAAEWKDSRTADTPPVMAIPPARLSKVIESSKAIGTDVLILDTAPRRNRAGELPSPAVRSCAALISKSSVPGRCVISLSALFQRAACRVADRNSLAVR